MALLCFIQLANNSQTESRKSCWEGTVALCGFSDLYASRRASWIEIRPLPTAPWCVLGSRLCCSELGGLRCILSLRFLALNPLAGFQFTYVNYTLIRLFLKMDPFWGVFHLANIPLSCMWKAPLPNFPFSCPFSHFRGNHRGCSYIHGLRVPSWAGSCCLSTLLHLEDLLSCRWQRSKFWWRPKQKKSSSSRRQAGVCVGVRSKKFSVIKCKEKIESHKCKKTVISWVRNPRVYGRFGGLVRRKCGGSGGSRWAGRSPGMHWGSWEGQVYPQDWKYISVLADGPVTPGQGQGAPGGDSGCHLLCVQVDRSDRCKEHCHCSWQWLQGGNYNRAFLFTPK